MVNPVACLVLLLISFPLPAQVIGKVFPEMAAETVKDLKVSVPKDVKGKFTILGLAYSPKAQDDFGTWFVPIYETFVQKPEGAFGGGYDVNVCFVTLFTGIKAAAEGSVKKEALKKIDSLLFPHVLFYKGELKKYRDELELKKKDIPYFFVLNKEGKIVYATSGSFSNEKLDDMVAVIE